MIMYSGPYIFYNIESTILVENYDKQYGKDSHNHKGNRGYCSLLNV